MFKISASIVTRFVVHGVYKVVIWSFLGVTRLHKVSGGIGHFATCSSNSELRLMEVVSQ